MLYLVVDVVVLVDAVDVVVDVVVVIDDVDTVLKWDLS